MSDRAAVTMMDLALKAVTLRLRELESDLWRTSPDRRDQLAPRIRQLKERQWELETRLSRLHREEPDSDMTGAEELYPAMQDAMYFILPDLVAIGR